MFKIIIGMFEMENKEKKSRFFEKVFLLDKYKYYLI